MESRNGGAFFLHEEDLRTVLSQLKSRTAMLVLGGAAFGKTTLLKRVEQELRKERQGGFALYLVDDPQEARRLILEARATPRVVLIDDLDLVCAPRPEDDASALKALDEALLRILADQKSIESSRFMATASVDAAGPTVDRLFRTMGNAALHIERVDAYSKFTQQLHSHRLRPWKAHWRKQREEQFFKAFRDVLKPASVLHTWRDAVLERTGGHPSLWGSMVDHLRDLCRRDAAGDAELGFERLLLGRGDPKTAGAVPAADIGRYIARRPPGDVRPPTEMHVRQILLDDGFLYQDQETGRFWIPGTILRALILEQARIGGAQQELDISLEPDPSATDSGTLKVRLGLSEKAVSLSGAQWRVMRALAERPGETLSRSRLHEVAELGNDGKAVINAVQRLQQKLKAHDLDDLIVNTYGKGYRLARLETPS
jgi:ATPase family associated with various cellular activities (AAA)